MVPTFSLANGMPLVDSVLEERLASPRDWRFVFLCEGWDELPLVIEVFVSTGKVLLSFPLIFSRLRVREDEERDSELGERFELVLMVEDNGGGKRNDDVAMGFGLERIFACWGLFRDVFGEIGGFRSVA